uniref:Immunoglobulin domain-containing protein n=1 Tax=Cyprinus carpio TaxID=7962 RepID=A0A8C2CXR3_CYPCA
MVGKHSRTMVSAFLVFCLCLRHLVDGTDEVMSVSVMEGESVSLNTSVTEVQNYHLIQWMFGETQIAEINNLIKINSIYGTDDDKTLQNRLNLDPQTGSLTITNTRTTDSGLYKLILTSRETRSKSFRVTVSESSSSSSCVSSSCAVNNSTLKHTENLNTEWNAQDCGISKAAKDTSILPSKIVQMKASQETGTEANTEFGRALMPSYLGMHPSKTAFFSFRMQPSC